MADLSMGPRRTTVFYCVILPHTVVWKDSHRIIPIIVRYRLLWFFVCVYCCCCHYGCRWTVGSPSHTVIIFGMPFLIPISAFCYIRSRNKSITCFIWKGVTSKKKQKYRRMEWKECSKWILDVAIFIHSNWNHLSRWAVIEVCLFVSASVAHFRLGLMPGRE